MNANTKSLKTLALLVVAGAVSALLSSQAKAESLNAGFAAVNRGRLRRAILHRDCGCNAQWTFSFLGRNRGLSRVR